MADSSVATGEVPVDRGSEFGRLDVLWEDGERRYCRAWRDTGGGVRRELLVAVPEDEQPSAGALSRLEHEYGLRDCLDQPWAVRPLELVRQRGRTMLVLEPTKGKPLDQVTHPAMQIEAFLRFAIAVTNALAGLHQCGLVHKDVKASNILVDAATWEVQLTGFGIASRLPRERQAPEPPELIAGTLSHMAPEQTGRMNRSVDSRSDLYSLGVTLYQALTGSLPFTASEPMEWVHCHIARKPAPLNSRRQDIPPQVCAIVMKLLAKTPEERYQTATGVERDLQRCLSDWESLGAIAEFPLGERDRTDRLRMPEKLYGREREVETLLASFDAMVTSGTPRLVLVSGHAGIGKSSVVGELHKVLVPQRGLFASGKFDQLKRDIPYATVAQAFQGLIRRLLSKPEIELQKWRDELRQALDPNGALVVQLIPELKFIVGEQPPVPDVPPHAAKIRFQQALRKLLGVFARAEHPLALFLDDLQWLDAASLELLEELLVQPDLQHLLLIGAYRDNEVDAAHPLTSKLAAIRQKGAKVEEIVLGALNADDLARLIADAFHGESQPAMQLSQLVHEKTAGNPFFVNQFMQELADDGLLCFDLGTLGWRWDLGPIRAKHYTDNVVDLLVGRLSRLPLATQQSLRALARLGNEAQTSVLALVHGTSEEELHADLWEALRSELIVRSDDSYRFVHDRVQEAAYSFTAEEQRAPEHLRIGRLLLAQVAPDERDKVIFEIVGHFNRATALLTSLDEREDVAALNLMASKRAKKAAAFASALSYLVAGMELMRDAGSRRHELVFELELHRAECEFLTGNVTSAEERLRLLASRATSVVERAPVTCLLQDVYFALQQPDRGLLECAECLRQAGLDLPLGATEARAREAYDRICSKVDGVGINQLAALPVVTDAASGAILDVLSKATSTAAVVDKNFEVFLACAAVDLTLERGAHHGACHAFEQLGYLAGWRFGDFEAAFRFGRLGHELLDRLGLRRFEGHVCLMYSTLVLPWAKHVVSCRPVIARTFEVSSNTGDHVWAVASRNVLLSNLLLAGDPLVDVEREAEVSWVFCRTAPFVDYTDNIGTQAALIRNLRGLTRRFGSLDDERFDETRMEDYFASQPHLLCAECWYWIRKLQARFLAGDYPAALEASLRAQGLLLESPGMLERAEHELYSALTRAALCESTSSDEGQQHLEAMLGHHRQLKVWARHCPENFENRAALVEAEIARIEGRELDAMRLYELAIRSARDNGFVHNQALAAELAGRFYAAHGFETSARAYMRDARYGYLRWGAVGKVRQLEEQHSYLLDDAPRADPTRTLETSVEHLDIATILKVLQAVSGEIDLKKLITTVMRLGLEHAGAENGLLILPRGDAWQIEAKATTSGDVVAVELVQEAITATKLPESVFQYVLRTRERVILEEASVRGEFAGDPYIKGRGARSVLCMPLLEQTRLVGVLYLENNLTSGAFRPTRMALLELLAADAAISLENARLYRDLQEREARVRRLVDSNIIGIFIWHGDGRILDTNDAFLQIMGYGREELISGGVRWTDFPAPGPQDRAAQPAEQIRESKVIPAHEWEYVKKDGGRVPVLVGGAIFDGTPDEGVAFVLDLTESKRSEQAARESDRRYHDLQLRLADANRIASIGELSASIAHEINQPLSGIITNAGTCLRLLAAQPPNIDGASETARRTLRDGNRASEVVTRLRALFAKKETASEPVDLSDAAREVLVMTSNELQRAGVSLRSELTDDPCVVIGDRVQLQQVIMNLLRNALDAMRSVQHGSRELAIRTELEEGGRVRLTVKDSGLGLGSMDPERVFEAFYTTKKSGMGIGLFVSRSIIERHRGRLWAEPDEGAGATFSFSIPI